MGEQRGGRAGREREKEAAWREGRGFKEWRRPKWRRRVRARALLRVRCAGRFCVRRCLEPLFCASFCNDGMRARRRRYELEIPRLPNSHHSHGPAWAWPLAGRGLLHGLFARQAAGQVKKGGAHAQDARHTHTGEVPVRRGARRRWLTSRRSHRRVPKPVPWYCLRTLDSLLFVRFTSLLPRLCGGATGPPKKHKQHKTPTNYQLNGHARRWTRRGCSSCPARPSAGSLPSQRSPPPSPPSRACPPPPRPSPRLQAPSHLPPRLPPPLRPPLRIPAPTPVLLPLSLLLLLLLLLLLPFLLLLLLLLCRRCRGGLARGPSRWAGFCTCFRAWLPPIETTLTLVHGLRVVVCH